MRGKTMLSRILRNVMLCAIVAISISCGGGGGSSGGGIVIEPPSEPSPPRVRFCLDGTRINENDVCMKICRDGSRIAETEICMKTCQNGNRISEFSTCLQTCPNGTRISENAVCMQTCPNGDRRPATQSCEFATREYARNRGVDSMNAEAAYLRGYFGQGVTVGVVDTGVNITHEDLRDNIVDGRDFVFPGSPMSDPGGHGTPVAGIIAGARNGRGSHGIAPQAKIMPLKTGDDDGRLVGDSNEAFRHAVSEGVQIVNNSFSSPAYVQGYYRGTVYRADIPYVFSPNWSVATERTETSKILNDIQYSDIVMVWAAGNQGWQPNGFVYLCSDITVRSVGNCDSTEITQVAREDFINEFVSHDYSHATRGTLTGIGVLSTVSGITRSYASRQGMWPYYAAAPSAYTDAVRGDFTALYADTGYIAMTDRWLVAVAVDENNEIDGYSNGCGNTSPWCLAAPGSNTYGPSAEGDSIYERVAGTSFATPHVSGALAVLRSRFPTMPMSVIRGILLTTATDLGSRGRDSVYGWGLVNLSAAINLQDTSLLITLPTFTMTMSSTETPSAQIFNLPPPRPANTVNYRTAEFDRQYGLNNIGAVAAYRRGYFGQGVTVAVVDTGMLTSHVDLRDNVVAGYDFVAEVSAINDGISDYWNPHGHGTFVGGIIAASQDNIGMHGVAPRAKLMPLQIGRGRTGQLVGDKALDAFRFAAAQNVQVVNNSWGNVSPLWGRYRGGYYQAWVPHVPEFWDDEDRAHFSEISAAIDNSDMVMVWAAGNLAWRSGGTVRLCQSLRDGVKFTCDSSQQRSVTVDEFIRGYHSIGYTITVSIRTNILSDRRNTYLYPQAFSSPGYGSILNVSVNSPGYYAMLPSLIPGLRDRWLAVVATDKQNRLASLSNPCGVAKTWCLAAPGVEIYSTSGAPFTFLNTPTPYRTLSGTSFSAPHVSGALAVLKSRLPDMPMSVVRAILLTTATDLGAPGVDDIYGWGLLNLEHAVRLQGRVSLPVEISSQQSVVLTPTVAASSRVDEGILLSDARVHLPHYFSHVKTQLTNAQAAVSVFGGFYYNTPLSGIVETEEAPALRLGDAARDMLPPMDAETSAGMLFFARDEKTGRFKNVGITIDDWRFRHDFCDDCRGVTWRDGFGAGDDSFVAPFFAENKSSFALYRSGEGLSPFAAFGDDLEGGDFSHRQAGLRWRLSGESFGMLTEVSHIDERDRFLGADFGALGKTRTQSRQAHVRLHGDLWRGWRGFAEYTRAHARADMEASFCGIFAVYALMAGRREWKAAMSL